jgi:hypothetical protein
MVSVLLVWFVVASLSTFWGGLIYRQFSQFSGEKSNASWFIYFWAGLAFFNIGLNFWCFFFPLYPWAKAFFWVLLSIPFAVWIARKENKRIIHEKFQQIHPLAWFPVLFTMFLALLKSSGHPEIFDEGAYHLPLIRMWETKGIVLGVANLNGHYGLHSGWHILSAFSNLNFLPGWELTLALNGLVASVLALGSGVSMSKIIRQKSTIADWILAFMPFFLFRNLLSSPSTDIPAIIGTWFLFCFWLDGFEKNTAIWKNWPVFLIIPIWIVTIKASSAVLLLIPAGLWILSFAEKENKKAILIVIFSLVILLPWFLQNWLISGYLVFPIKWTTIFHPQWLVPQYFIQKKFYLEQFGAFAPPKLYNLQWLKNWFSAHNADTRIILILSALGMTSGFFTLIFQPKTRNWHLIYLFGTLLACLLSWLLTITEPRYGFGALVFTALFSLAFPAFYLSGKFPWLRYGILFLILSQGFMLWKTIKENPIQTAYLIKPHERPIVGFRKIRLQNFQANFPVAYLSDVPVNKPVFCWDCPFPCFPKESRGDSSLISKGNFSGREMYKSTEPKTLKISD